MIRLLSVQPVAERGGSDQALLRMIRSLPPDRFACHIAQPAAGPLADAFAAAGATVHAVPMRRISTSHDVLAWLAYALCWPVAVVRLARLIRRTEADIVHTNSLHSWYGWAAAALARRPHVWHAREIVVQSGAALRVERFLTRRFAVRVIAMSQAIADQLDPTNVEVAHEFADPGEFRPNRAGSFRSRAGIPDDVPLVGAHGRIDTWKGFDVLLDAFTAAVAERPELHLVVAGGPVEGKEHYAQELAARAAAIPNVHWLGPRDDIPDLLADLDVWVLPSTEPEPYGLAVVEALASGVPVIATDAGGPPEILAAAAPGAGRLVPPRDAGALARSVTEITPRTSSVPQRAARPSLQRPEPARFAEIFAAVVRDR